MDKTKEITQLIKAAGSDRKAVSLIKQVKGVAPVHSALVKARQGKGTPYIIQCYIDDLKKALGENKALFSD